MSALRKIKVRGISVEVWSTSFRLKGMSTALQVGPNLTDEKVKQIVEAIYVTVEQHAMRTGIARAVAHMTRVIEGGAP